MSWDDVRYFLAVARTGSLAAAARDLGVQHSTVGRRIQAFEDHLGTRLFARQRDGFRLTPAGQAVVAGAEAAERAVLDIGRSVRASEEHLDGIVRVTTSEGFSPFLITRLGALRSEHPGIHIEVITGNTVVDLARGDADIAVRFMKTDQQELISKKLGASGWGLYAATSYREGRGACAESRPLDGHDVVAYDASLSGTPGGRFIDEHLGSGRVVLRANSLVSALNAAIGGLGVAAVPCFLGDKEATLVRMRPEVIGTRDIYLVVHPDVASVTRVRVVMDFLAAIVTREATLLRG